MNINGTQTKSTYKSIYLGFCQDKNEGMFNVGTYVFFYCDNRMVCT